MSTSTITGRDPATGRCISLFVSDGVIARVEESSDSSDLFLCAGLVDLQVNGYAGFDVNASDVTTETIDGLTHTLLSRGVTCFIPTIITASEQSICKALATIAQARRKCGDVAACVPFAHVEGPHISPFDGYRGAHPLEAIRPPSLAEFDGWQNAADGCVGMVTLSPHYAGSAAYISALVHRGVRVAIGHTHATAAQIHAAVEAGATLSTHLGNGIAPEIPRHLNPIWPQLADDRLTASFIADGHHLPQDVLQVMLRAKGVQRSVLVSDSVAVAGLKPGSYNTPVGGRVELRADGRVCIPGTELLAGAASSLADCVSHIVNATKFPLHVALRMATENPGKVAGGRGQLLPGTRADIIRFRWQGAISIEDVWLAGERVQRQVAS